MAEERPASRNGIGGWLNGPPRADTGQAYPGEDLGLPREGAGSVASMGRRFLALLVDWFACLAIALAFARSSRDVTLYMRVWPLVIFAAETYLLTALTGFTLGKRLLGIRVARMDGKPVGFGWALVRTLLLLAVVPPLVTDGDTRGLHDRAANTVVVRL